MSINIQDTSISESELWEHNVSAKEEVVMGIIESSAEVHLVGDTL